jgi:ADP-heptose:LPS heptosyltransferase
MKNQISIKEFNDKKDKILIIRDEGHFGDILMHRMLFEDIKALIPDSHITFACPKRYHDAAMNHPYIDNLMDSGKVNVGDFLYVYNTANSCEEQNHHQHKSDTWAEKLGIKLANHHMHLHVDASHTDSSLPLLILAPFASDKKRSLSASQANDIIQHFDGKYDIRLVHNCLVEGLCKDGIIFDTFIHLAELVASASLVVSVDTSILHLAGGLNKNTIGLFSWTSGKIMCQYYPTVKYIQHKSLNLSDDFDIGRLIEMAK